MPSGATDLAEMLATLEVVPREEPYVYAAVRPGHPSTAVADAVIQEEEATTVVLRRSLADAAGIDHEFVAAWLTLRVHSSLAAVGLTAAVAGALADAGISCNVLAGAFHDHLLVPVEDEQEALAVLSALRERHAGTGS